MKKTVDCIYGHDRFVLVVSLTGFSFKFKKLTRRRNREVLKFGQFISRHERYANGCEEASSNPASLSRLALEGHSHAMNHRRFTRRRPTPEVGVELPDGLLDQLVVSTFQLHQDDSIKIVFKFSRFYHASKHVNI